MVQNGLFRTKGNSVLKFFPSKKIVIQWIIGYHGKEKVRGTDKKITLAKA